MRGVPAAYRFKPWAVKEVVRVKAKEAKGAVKEVLREAKAVAREGKAARDVKVEKAPDSKTTKPTMRPTWTV